MPGLRKQRSWEDFVFNGNTDRLDANPFVCFAEPDPEPPAPPPEPEKQLPQSEVTKLVAREVKKAADKAAADARAAAETEKAALQKERDDALEAAKLATATAAEKEKHAAEKLQKQQETKVAELERRAVEAEAKANALAAAQKQSVINTQLSRALTEAKALVSGTSLAHATHFFATGIEVVADDNGLITGVTYDDVPQKDLKAAAEAWLQANPQYLSAPSGGSGTGTPGGGGAGGKSLAGKTSAQLGRSPTDLMTEGLKNVGIGR